jgi:CMP-N,N'-diacetyllegionaminic acid synthase
MDVLGLIPARGGSKAIPHKNIVSVAGRPLLSYTCEAALESRMLSRVLLSTDDASIQEIGLSCGVEAPFLRPSEFARDVSPMLDVIVHALGWLQNEHHYQPEIVVLLQPTSPLRRAEHIDGAIQLLLADDADTVVSVVEVPHQFNPVSLMKLDGPDLKPFMDGSQILRRQDKPAVFARNGPAILAIKRSVIESGRLYGEHVRPFLMSVADSLDVDEKTDLTLAEFWLAGRK